MPEPILVAIAAALASKAIQTFYDFVRTRIGNRRPAVAALEAAQGKPPNSPEVQVLAAELERIEDPDFHTELRARWQAVQHVTTQNITQDQSGTFFGTNVQAGNIEGDLNIKP